MNVVSDSKVRSTLGLMMHKPDEAVTGQVARDLCERTDSQAVLRLAVARAGGLYLITEDATNRVDGNTMATARQDIARIDDLPQAIMKNGASIRHTLGESRRMIARLNQSLVPVATGSMEALWTIAWWDLGELELACKYLDSGPFQSEYDTLRIVAELGDPTKAEVLLRDYLANHSQSTMWSRRYAPLLRGEFALMAHKPQEALVLMEPARQYDDASHDGYYLRGLAYMQANQLPQAEAEFRNLLAHAYIEPTGSSLPLAQLQLARILAREGNRAASAEAYRRFLDAWKNGDPGRPLVLAARKELKALEDGK